MPIIGLICAAAVATAAPNLAMQPTDPKDLSQAFWTGWKAERVSDGYRQTLAAAGGRAAVAKAQTVDPRLVQHVADLAIQNPKDAAGIMMAAAVEGQSSETRAALQTAMVMRTTPDMRQKAVQALPPQAQAAGAAFAANLSHGIPGLPGIYLSGQGENRGGAERGAAPSGFQPVSGGSGACPVR